LNSNNSSERKPPINNAGEKQLEKLTDSAESATNRFRDRFEDFLHQDTLPPPPTSPIVSLPPATTTTGMKNFDIKKMLLIDLFKMLEQKNRINGVKMVFQRYVH
jgi:hypothetical protein